MMNNRYFWGERLCELVNQELESSEKCTFSEYKKTNGVEVEAILVPCVQDCSNHRINATIPIGEYLDKACKASMNTDMDALLQKLASEISESIKEHRKTGIEPDIAPMMQMENLRLKMINTEKYRAVLDDCPHIDYLDLSVVPIISAPLGESRASCYISYRLAEEMDWDTREIWKNAFDNAYAEGIISKSMESFLPFLASDSDMYVLSTGTMVNGACVLAFHDPVRELAEMLESDLVIIPSSIHEVIAIPDNVIDDEVNFTEMIESVNSTVVDPEEVLSDHPYYYHRKEDKLSSVS